VCVREGESREQRVERRERRVAEGQAAPQRVAFIWQSDRETEGVCVCERETESVCVCA